MCVCVCAGGVGVGVGSQGCNPMCCRWSRSVRAPSPCSITSRCSRYLAPCYSTYVARCTAWCTAWCSTQHIASCPAPSRRTRRSSSRADPPRSGERTRGRSARRRPPPATPRPTAWSSFFRRGPQAAAASVETHKMAWVPEPPTRPIGRGWPKPAPACFRHRQRQPPLTLTLTLTLTRRRQQPVGRAALRRHLGGHGSGAAPPRGAEATAAAAAAAQAAAQGGQRDQHDAATRLRLQC